MVKIFLDGADAILENRNNPEIAGFTTNPTLMKKAGITDYEAFAKKILFFVKEKPVAFEVLSDDFEEMYRQALIIGSWGKNVNVKIPITNTKGESSILLISELIKEGVNINVTAITMFSQIVLLMPMLSDAKHGYISVFAGRIADTGVDPMPVMKKIVYFLKECPNIEFIWASAREIFNVRQAESCECNIITLSSELYKKYPLFRISLNEMSLNTVKMFYNDGKSFCIR
jgi:transaldolase